MQWFCDLENNGTVCFWRLCCANINDFLDFISHSSRNVFVITLTCLILQSNYAKQHSTWFLTKQVFFIWHKANSCMINPFGAGLITLKSIICPYWPSLCNFITHKLVVLESCTNLQKTQWVFRFAMKKVYGFRFAFCMMSQVRCFWHFSLRLPGPGPNR